MKRNGKPLANLRDGHPRRMADARNAFRKMNDQQRQDFLAWIRADFLTDFAAACDMDPSDLTMEGN